MGPEKAPIYPSSIRVQSCGQVKDPSMGFEETAVLEFAMTLNAVSEKAIAYTLTSVSV